MRHLTPAELLLYAEGELDDRGLCRHVVGCVDCKATLVDVQESYVLVAQQVREFLPPGPPGHDQLVMLRSRMAAEAQVREMHLSTKDLLLSLEERLDDATEAHLATCEACRGRASRLHTELSAIEFELRRKPAFNLPVERRAKALAALRGRIGSEITSSEPHGPPRGLAMRFRMPDLRPLLSYGGALAAACALAWVGWNAVPPPTGTGPPVRVETRTPTVGQRIPIAPAQLPAATSETAEPSPERFAEIGSRSVRPPAAVVLQPLEAPTLESLPQAGAALLALDLPRTDDLPSFQGATARREVEQAATAVEVPLSSQGPQDPTLVAEGNLMLVRSGLWKSTLQAGGSGPAVRFSGTLASERERAAAQRALLAVADGLPIEFDIGVGGSRPVGAPSVSEVAWRQGTLGGPVRNALLQHYEDAARRSFRQPAQGLLESELDRFVSGIVRHDSELLSHVHRLHRLVTSAPSAKARPDESFRQVAKFHLDGIGNHQAGISSRLSESLPRRFWAYRGERRSAPRTEGAEATAEQLLDDALALDQALAGLFFGSGATLDARASNLSTADLLARIRQHTRQLRAAIR
ncbi:MAG: hypothetical protein OXN89_06255 [Bryobacterales bacterium]|nr:hypothetical protein [Bryobacterales bacterium]